MLNGLFFNLAPQSGDQLNEMPVFRCHKTKIYFQLVSLECKLFLCGKWYDNLPLPIYENNNKVSARILMKIVHNYCIFIITFIIPPSHCSSEICRNQST